MSWWVSAADQEPVGPVTTDLILEAIGDGRVPRETLVCEVGGQEWRWIGEVTAFAEAVSECTVDGANVALDLWPSPPIDLSLAREEDTAEHTIVDQLEGPTESTLDFKLQTFDDREENTVVEPTPADQTEPD